MTGSSRELDSYGILQAYWIFRHINSWGIHLSYCK